MSLYSPLGLHWTFILYIWENMCYILMKVGTGSVAILDFKMEVCLHPVHHIGILFSYYFTIFMSNLVLGVPIQA